MPKAKIVNEEETITIPSKKSSMNYLPWVLLLIVILVGAGFIYKQTMDGKKLQAQIMDLKQNPAKASQEESKALLDKVGQLIELPNEQPTIATVTDLAALKDQPFFANAQIGDKVLIYSQAKKAVLYRPSTNKVIEVAPVNLDSTPTNANVNGNTNASTKAVNANVSTNTKNTNTNKAK